MRRIAVLVGPHDKILSCLEMSFQTMLDANEGVGAAVSIRLHTASRKSAPAEVREPRRSGVLRYLTLMAAARRVAAGRTISRCIMAAAGNVGSGRSVEPWAVMARSVPLILSLLDEWSGIRGDSNCTGHQRCGGCLTTKTKRRSDRQNSHGKNPQSPKLHQHPLLSM